MNSDVKIALKISHKSNFTEGYFAKDGHMPGKRILIDTKFRTKACFWKGMRIGYAVDYDSAGKIIKEGYVKNSFINYETADYDNGHSKYQYFKETKGSRIYY